MHGLFFIAILWLGYKPGVSTILRPSATGPLAADKTMESLFHGGPLRQKNTIVIFIRDKHYTDREPIVL